MGLGRGPAPSAAIARDHLAFPAAGRKPNAADAAASPLLAQSCPGNARSIHAAGARRDSAGVGGVLPRLRLPLQSRQPARAGGCRRAGLHQHHAGRAASDVRRVVIGALGFVEPSAQQIMRGLSDDPQLAPTGASLGFRDVLRLLRLFLPLLPRRCRRAAPARCPPDLRLADDRVGAG